MCSCKVGYGDLQDQLGTSSTSSFFTTKLGRMVGGLKRKRKSLAAQHALLLDLLSSPANPASLMALFPLLNSSHDICTSASPPPSQVFLAPRPPPPPPPSSPHLPSSTSSMANATSVQDINTERRYLYQANTAVEKMNNILETKTPCPYLAAPRALWAVLLLALLGTLLYTGKEVAMLSYLVLWLAWKLKVFARRAFACMMTCRLKPHGGCKSLDDDGGRAKCRSTRGAQGHRLLIRSSTIPRRRRGVALALSSLQWRRRSKSLMSRFHGRMQDEDRASMKASIHAYSARCNVYGKTISSASTRVKLHIMIVVVLCGLAHGRILALCMALCSIFILDSGFLFELNC